MKALIGFSKTFTHMDGRTVSVKRDSVTEPSQVITLASEGMPKHNFGSEKGNSYRSLSLHITF